MHEMAGCQFPLSSVPVCPAIGHVGWEISAERGVVGNANNWPGGRAHCPFEKEPTLGRDI